MSESIDKLIERGQKAINGKAYPANVQLIIDELPDTRRALEMACEDRRADHFDTGFYHIHLWHRTKPDCYIEAAREEREKARLE